MGRVGELARKLAFQPEKLPRSLVSGIALLPPVGAGLAIFGLPAAYALGVAVGAGVLAHAGLLLGRRRPAASPIVVAVAGVALIGPGAPLWWAGAVAGSACVLEVARTLLPGRPLPIHTGLLAYAAVYLAGQGGIALYLAPGRGDRPLPEPIRLWHDFFGGAGAPIDPVTLYVGNVAGPVFATSLLAIGVGAAWLWYARRLDLVALLGIAAGGISVTVVEGWNPAFQMLTGPLWFAAVYAYADRRLLAGPPLVGALLGYLAGFIGVGLRTRGLAVEAAVITIAAVQLGVAVLDGLAQFLRRGKPRKSDRPAAGLARSPAGQLK